MSGRSKIILVLAVVVVLVIAFIYVNNAVLSWG